MKKLIACASFGLASLVAAAVPNAAFAAPHNTPIGFTGACNMVASWPGASPSKGVAVQSGGGMENAMSVNNLNGNDGMNQAVTVSDGYCP